MVGVKVRELSVDNEFGVLWAGDERRGANCL